MTISDFSIPAEGWADASQATLDSYNMASVADALAASADYLSSLGDRYSGSLETVGVWVDGEFISLAAAQAESQQGLVDRAIDFFADITDWFGEIPDWLAGIFGGKETELKDTQRTVEELIAKGVDYRLIQAMVDLEEAKSIVEGELTKTAEGIWGLLGNSFANFGNLLVGLLASFTGWFWDRGEEKLYDLIVGRGG